MVALTETSKVGRRAGSYVWEERGELRMDI